VLAGSSPSASTTGSPCQQKTPGGMLRGLARVD